MLGLGSKRVYFTPTRARTRLKSELPLLILLCGGLALGEPACRYGGGFGFRDVLVRALWKSCSEQRPNRVVVICSLCRRRRVPFQEL